MIAYPETDFLRRVIHIRLCHGFRVKRNDRLSLFLIVNKDSAVPLFLNIAVIGIFRDFAPVAVFRINVLVEIPAVALPFSKRASVERQFRVAERPIGAAVTGTGQRAVIERKFSRTVVNLQRSAGTVADNAVIDGKAAGCVRAFKPDFAAAIEVHIAQFDVFTGVQIDHVAGTGAQIRMSQRQTGQVQIGAVFKVEDCRVTRVKHDLRIRRIVRSAANGETVHVADQKFHAVIALLNLYIIVTGVPVSALRVPEFRKVFAEIVVTGGNGNFCAGSDCFQQFFRRTDREEIRICFRLRGGAILRGTAVLRGVISRYSAASFGRTAPAAGKQRHRQRKRQKERAKQTESFSIHINFCLSKGEFFFSPPSCPPF